MIIMLHMIGRFARALLLSTSRPQSPWPSQDGHDSARRTLAVAALAIPLGAVVSVAVCSVAQGWSGDLSPETHSTAVALQGVPAANPGFLIPLFAIFPRSYHFIPDRALPCCYEHQREA